MEHCTFILFFKVND